MRINLTGKSGPSDDPMLELIRRELEKQQPGSIGEANRILSGLTGSYNQTPQPELGGLSPEQTLVLTGPNWMNNALTLNRRLALGDLRHAPLFQNARILLQAIKESGVEKATATGAFNRKLSHRMMDAFTMPAKERDLMTSYKSVFNQDDVPSLRLLRHLLPAADLLLFENGELRLTKTAAEVLGDSNAGELYARIFRALFLRLNIAAFDRLPEQPHVQATIGFGLYRFYRRAAKWVDIEEIGPKLFVPAVLESLPELAWTTSSTDYAYLRIIRWLRDFGLAECDPDDFLKRPTRTRKTSLFDRFIEFNLPRARG